MKLKNAVLLILLVMLVLLVFAGCSPSSPPEPKVDPTPAPKETGNYWRDKLGEPKYGGDLTFVAMNALESGFDPANWPNYAAAPIHSMLFAPNWAIDRSIWEFNTVWTPEEHWVPLAAESWEWVDSQNMIIHIRKGVHWHDKPPVNGREFTAYDVEYHYDRMLGTGNGFTEPNPLFAGFARGLEKVTAADKYTVHVKFKAPGIFFNSQSIFESINMMWVNREVMESDASGDWTKAVGIGPFVLTDYDPGVSITFSRNPNFFANDLRFPQNQLPYVDSIKKIVIPDASTRLAALRTAKIDSLDNLNRQETAALERSNPEIRQWKIPASGTTQYMRIDKEPFTDIRVRKALQMSLDLKTIAQSHYGGIVDGQPAGILSPGYTGWNFPYADWPQELKDEYSYNPQKAKQLLAEAGYPNGFATNVYANKQGDTELLQIIKAYFFDIGVDLEIKLMDFPTLMAFANAAKHDQMLAWTSMNGHKPEISINTFHSNEPRNRAQVKDPAYDAIVANFLNAPTKDEAKRWAIEADEYYIRSHFAVDVFPIATFTAYQPHVKGYDGEMFGQWDISYNWAQLWIDRE